MMNGWIGGKMDRKMLKFGVGLPERAATYQDLGRDYGHSLRRAGRRGVMHVITTEKQQWL
jgi:hypothetical protein